MTTTVLLFAPESACPIDRNPSDWAWVSVSETGAALEQGTGPLDQMPATSENRTIVLILDGQRVRILKEALPARSDAQARKTAPYVLEERLAAPPTRRMSLLVHWQATCARWRFVTMTGWPAKSQPLQTGGYDRHSLLQIIQCLLQIRPTRTALI